MVPMRDVRQALWSVYFYRYFQKDSQPVPKDVWEKVRPISLPDAIQTLRNAVDAAPGVAAKQIAYMRLRDAWVLHPDIFDTPPVPPAVDAKEAMKVYKLDALPSLVEGKVKYYKALKAFQMPTYTDPSEVPTDPLDEIPNIHPAFRTQEIVPNSGWFELRNKVCDITSHCATNSMSAVWSIDVNRPFSAMLTVLDPRNWDYCSAYVELAASQDGAPACPLNDPGPPPNSGSDWTDYFCERIGTGFASGLTISNRLFFTFTNQAPGIIVTFSDVDPRGANTGVDPLIEFDRGWVAAGSVPDDAGSTRIRGFKYLRFTQPWLKTLAVPLMESWISEEINTGTACAVP